MKLLDLLPKEKIFYEQLDTLTDCAKAATEALHHLFESSDRDARLKCGDQVAQAKAEAKHTYNQLNNAVCVTFITPFDPEDLQELATCLYSISKLQDKIQTRLLSVGWNESLEPLKRFSLIIARQSDALQQLMQALVKNKKPRVIHEKAAVIDELEDQGDELFNELIVALYKEPLETRDLLLRKDLFEMLEDVTDTYRDSAAVALRIILKHS